MCFALKPFYTFVSIKLRGAIQLLVYGACSFRVCVLLFCFICNNFQKYQIYINVHIQRSSRQQTNSRDAQSRTPSFGALSQFVETSFFSLNQTQDLSGFLASNSLNRNLPAWYRLKFFEMNKKREPIRVKLQTFMDFCSASGAKNA